MHIKYINQMEMENIILELVTEFNEEIMCNNLSASDGVVYYFLNFQYTFSNVSLFHHK